MQNKIEAIISFNVGSKTGYLIVFDINDEPMYCIHQEYWSLSNGLFKKYRNLFSKISIISKFHCKSKENLRHLAENCFVCNFWRYLFSSYIWIIAIVGFAILIVIGFWVCYWIRSEYSLHAITDLISDPISIRRATSVVYKTWVDAKHHYIRKRIKYCRIIFWGGQCMIQMHVFGCFQPWWIWLQLN